MLLVASLWFGGKFYLEHQYREVMEFITTSVREYVDVDFGDLDVDGSGTIVVRDLTLRAPGSDEQVSIETARISFGDFVFFLTGREEIMSGKLPLKIDANLERVSIPASMLKSKSGNVPCFDVSSIFDYKSIGYETLDVNMSIRFNLIRPNKASLRVNSEDPTASSSMRVEFDPAGVRLENLLDDPKAILGGEIGYEIKPKAAADLINHCAQLFDMGRHKFLEQVVSSKKFSENSFEADLGEEGRSALREFFKGGKQVRVTLKPTSMLDQMDSELSYDSKQWVDMLGLTATLDGQPISLSQMEVIELPPELTLEPEPESELGLELEFVPELEEPIADLEPESKPAAEPDVMSELKPAPEPASPSLQPADETTEVDLKQKSEPESAKVIKKPIKKRQYKISSLSNAQEYLQKSIRISRTRDRESVEGKLVAISNGVLIVEVHHFGGKTRYQVPYSSVSRIEVER